MSEYVEFTFCELPETPVEFDREKFKTGDVEQRILYKNSKTPRRKRVLTYEQITDEELYPNYARVVPKGCMFIDFDDPDQADRMHEIILHSGLRCLILETVKGYHFMFRIPDFYEKEMTGATNWFGYKFDCKATTAKHEAVQIMRVCGMTREERTSWDLSAVVPSDLNIETLDVLPYWLWGKLKDKDLHKGGKPGESEYHLTDTPFTQLMVMKEGGRHNHIVERCSHFGLTNGFQMDEFKKLIQMIHDKYLVKIGDPMPDTDLFGDLDKRWDDYDADMRSSGWDFDEKTRKWIKSKSKKENKVTEREAAMELYKLYDCYVTERNVDGTYNKLFYRHREGTYDYQSDVTKLREGVKGLNGDQNFKIMFFKEVEEQLKQMCVENSKLIKRSPQYVIVKNKVLSCVMPDAYDFEWLGTRPPTDVVFPWNWRSEEWVNSHEDKEGKLISKFIKEVARNSSGVTDPIVEQWLYVIAGAAMIPSSQLEKIIVLSGGGSNGKSIYTSLIRLCLGGDMFNMSKIFDSGPQDSFWGEGLDKGILCVVDDLPQHYSRDAFSYIKGAITKTDTVIINPKFKPKKELDALPLIIACSNFEFELFDKSEGMRRRVLILPTEYEIPVELRDFDMQFKLVLNTMDKAKVAEYKMQDNFSGDPGVKVKELYTREKGVLESLDHGSLCWFANKARYMYFKWLFKEILLESSDGMKERLEGTFSGGFDAEVEEFLEWYVTEIKKGIWTRELYDIYLDWHNESDSLESEMKQKTFSMKLNKAIKSLSDKGYKLGMKKRKNDKGMSLNYLFIGDETEED